MRSLLALGALTLFLPETHEVLSHQQSVEQRLAQTGQVRVFQDETVNGLTYREISIRSRYTDAGSYTLVIAISGDGNAAYSAANFDNLGDPEHGFKEEADGRTISQTVDILIQRADADFQTGGVVLNIAPLRSTDLYRQAVKLAGESTS